MIQDNGINFDVDSPIMTGTWYNPKNGDSFTVRDCYFENNEYKVQCTDGRLLSYNQIQNYIKSDKPITKQPKVNPEVTKNSKIEIGNIQITKENEILDDDVNTLLKPVNMFNKQQEAPKKSINYEIIDRILKEEIEHCRLNTILECENTLNDKVSILYKMMNISIDEITEYIYDNKFNKKDILNDLNTKITSFLDIEKEQKEEPKQDELEIEKEEL